MVLAKFCQQRGISTDGLVVTVRWEKDQTRGHYVGIESHVSLPRPVPEEIRKAIARVAEHCTVDRTIRHTDSVPVHFHYGE